MLLAVRIVVGVKLEKIESIFYFGQGFWWKIEPVRAVEMICFSYTTTRSFLCRSLSFPFNENAKSFHDEFNYTPHKT